MLLLWHGAGAPAAPVDPTFAPPGGGPPARHIGTRTRHAPPRPAPEAEPPAPAPRRRGDDDAVLRTQAMLIARHFYGIQIVVEKGAPDGDGDLEEVERDNPGT